MTSTIAPPLQAPAHDAAWLPAAIAILALLAVLTFGLPVQRAIVMIALAPAFEEIVFRLGVQDRLMRWTGSATVANLGTAALFALAHLITRGDLRALWVALPALAIGYVYARAGRVGLCIGLHAAANAMWLVWQVA
ncbi:MAG: JDVT-CTERM system glutamic-type intramembrane protease [Caldimonas sp.]